jgi:hypothetical protein
MLIAGVLFLVSAWYAFTEMRNMVWGRTTPAVVTGVRHTMSAGWRRRPMQVFEYLFTDADGKTRNEQDEVSTDWPAPTASVDVQHIPGAGGVSRLKGHSNFMSVYFFAGSLLWIGVSLYRILREANEPIRRPWPAERKTGFDLRKMTTDNSRQVIQVISKLQ